MIYTYMQGGACCPVRFVFPQSNGGDVMYSQKQIENQALIKYVLFCIRKIVTHTVYTVPPNVHGVMNAFLSVILFHHLLPRLSAICTSVGITNTGTGRNNDDDDDDDAEVVFG